MAISIPDGKPYISYDPQGEIFAAYLTTDGVSLYDPRNHGKGPFKSFDHTLGKSAEITGLKFSPNGRQIMVTTTNQIHLYDAFTGVKSSLTLGGHVNRTGVALEASFSPDSQYIFSGSTDGRVHVWNAFRGYKVCVLDAETPEAIRCVKFSPKHMLLATGCSVLSFWLPALHQDALKEEFPDMDDVIVPPRN